MRACVDRLVAPNKNWYLIGRTQYNDFTVDFTFGIMLAMLSRAPPSWPFSFSSSAWWCADYWDLLGRDSTTWSNCSVYLSSSFFQACNMFTWKTNAPICFWSRKFTVRSIAHDFRGTMLRASVVVRLRSERKKKKRT